MKRTLRFTALALALLLAAALLAACGSAGGAGGAPAGSEAAMDSMAANRGGGLYEAGELPLGEPGGNGQLMGTKRICTADMTLETTAFDDASAALSRLVASAGGWFEFSSVENGSDGYRYGSYTARVPQDRFDEFLTQVGDLAHVIRRTSNVEDVTEAYYDADGRLKTQQTKLARLQELLARAENMEDIIAIESAISETEQQIDELSGQLRHYDARIDYAAVTLTLREVYQLSNVEEPAAGLSGRLSTGLASGWHGFVGFLQGLLVLLAYGWVWVLLALAALLAVLALRRRRRAAAAPGKSAGPAPQKPDDKQS